MFLTVSKRFEFCASRRLYVDGRSSDQNLRMFGAETTAAYGTGRNYTVWFVFHGDVDPSTGMLINVTEIKQRLGRLIDTDYDHRFLNKDNPAFADTLPTVENIAQRLLSKARATFADEPALPVVCHLQESPTRAATAYDSGVVESDYQVSFSAARQTMSPHLTAEENSALFGAAASPLGHGHYYRLRITLRGRPDERSGLIVSADTVTRALTALRNDFDHKNLNKQVSDLSNRPITTESITQVLAARLRRDLPVDRIRLYELPHFFAECNSQDGISLGWQDSFSAAHRLHTPGLSDEDNHRIYGKCNNPAGHGHTYRVEATISDYLDSRSGTILDLLTLSEGIHEALAPWRDKHLDIETGDFRQHPSTSENIILVLWPRINSRLNGRLSRLRLWETANNRFTLRKGISRRKTRSLSRG